MHDIGKWMKINGEAIYNTRMFKVYGEGDKIRFTRSKDGKTKYIFLFDFSLIQVTIAKMAFMKDDKIQLLGTDRRINWKQTVDGVDITIPAALKAASQHVLKVTSGQ